MLTWLVPISAFWPVTALYLGGMSVDLEGGSGFRQVLGLILSFAFFLVLWGALHAVLGRMGGVVWAQVVPTVLAILALPAEARAGFRLVGVRVKRVAPHEH